ncbi:uncharacterized protein LOC125178325 [Hyalella azteca]|uniref:Uncharacterized protein LOC125178325 n=1 Tax=Hyalella azteca TaxID=294128 RepID=A0A979FL78_HYAAZ|nr:uncharacterized protein LOC125178325 [Hyalella azteca]
MPSTVENFLLEDKVAEATAYVQGDNVEYRTLENIKIEDEDIVTYAMLLSIKKPKKSARTLVGKKTMIAEYDRLFLFREVIEGKLFYVLCKYQTNTNCLLWAEDDIFIGSCVAFFEPTLEGDVHGIPLIQCETRPVPIIVDLAKIKISPILPTLQDSEHLTSFFIEVSDIDFCRITPERACASRQCDSHHMTNTSATCPGQSGGSTRNIALYAPHVSIPELQHQDNHGEKTTFYSESLAQLFIHPNSLKRATLNTKKLRLAVSRILLEYKKNKITWLVAGWFKRHYGPDGTPSKVRKHHLVSIVPRRILDVQLYDENTTPGKQVKPNITAPGRFLNPGPSYVGEFDQRLDVDETEESLPEIAGGDDQERPSKRCRGDVSN